MSRVRRAAHAFEAFKGEKPRAVRKSRLPDADVVGWEMGPMVGVAYQARRDGKTAQYFHEFKPNARPRLVAQDDGRQLYIEGGRYKVTDRGIEDMPRLMVVNPSPRSGRTSKGKGSTMARRARRRRSHVSIYTSNPRRRRRSTARRVYNRNPRRRRHHARRAAPRRIYRRNPTRARRRASARRYRRNPSGGAVGKLSELMIPAVMIGLGAVGAEYVTGMLPVPMAWKTGPMRYVVKAGVGVALGLVLAKGFKMKRAGYYFAAGAVAIATHDFVKAWLVQSQLPGAKGLGYVNPGSVGKFGMYQRALPTNRLGQYVQSRPSQLGGDAPLANARQPGGEMNFAA